MTKQPEEIALLAESGRLLADVFSHLDQLNLIGMSTMQVNDLVDDLIVHELAARPASKGQYGYAYALNASPNSVGLPRRPLRCGHPAGRGHRQFRYHAGKERLHCRLQQDLSGGRRTAAGQAAGAYGV